MTGLRPVAAAGVVVPAHNEAELLPACLAALRSAADVAGVPVRLLVVADACTDETAAVAAAGGAEVIRIRARNVGVARAAGMARLLPLLADFDPAATWLATTDADTVVPPGWLRRQLGYADQGWDVVLGTVTVTDWTGHPPQAAAMFAAMYGFGDGPHPHVHGANLGLRASAYLAAGGFRPLRTAEDHALIAAATEAGCRVRRASDLTVVTSARRQARAPRGFSHALRTLAADHGAGDSRAAAGGVLSPPATGSGAALTGALIAERRYFTELVEGNPLMSALEPSSGLLGKEYAKETEAESDHHLHIRTTPSRNGITEGLWRISLKAVDGWSLGADAAAGGEDDRGPFARLLGTP